MKEIAREGIIYQLLAVGLTFLLHPDSEFLSTLLPTLIITNCIA